MGFTLDPAGVSHRSGYLLPGRGLQPCRARSDARTSTAVRYPPGGVGVSVLRVGSRARARCATAVRRVTGRSGGRRSSRDEGDAGRGRGVSGYHLAGGRRSQAASRASFSVRRPAGLPGTRRIAQDRGFHPRSRRRLPPVRVSSARSQHQPCRARSDARTSTAVRYLSPPPRRGSSRADSPACAALLGFDLHTHATRRQSPIAVYLPMTTDRSPRTRGQG